MRSGNDDRRIGDPRFDDVVTYVREITEVLNCLETQAAERLLGVKVSPGILAPKLLCGSGEERPVARSTDVVVEVKACGMVPSPRSWPIFR